MKLLYQFSAGESFLHRLDPRSKLAFVAGFAIATFVVPFPWYMALAVIAAIWLLGGISPRQYLGFLAFLLPIMAAITLVHLVTGPPPYLPGTILSQAGLQTGLVLAFRLAALGIAFIMFSLTTDPYHLGLSLHQAGLPYKLAFMFAFALRFLPLLQEEMLVIRNALRARAYRGIQTRNPVRFIQGVGVSIIPLGLSALRRSQDIALAMELRGFSYPEEAGVPRVMFRDVRLRPADWLFTAATLALLLLAIGYRLWV